jgi:hypothetical protein
MLLYMCQKQERLTGLLLVTNQSIDKSRKQHVVCSMQHRDAVAASYLIDHIYWRACIDQQLGQLIVLVRVGHQSYRCLILDR